MARLYIDEEICKGCGLCVYYCARGVFEMTSKLNKKGFAFAGAAHPEKCTACKLCEINCPDLAIFVEADPGK